LKTLDFRFGVVLTWIRTFMH